MYECFRFADKEKEYIVPLPYGLDLDIVNKVEIRGREFVPVVRCKECKHRPKYDGPNRVVFPDGICPCQCDDEYYNWMPSDDWLCPDGEKVEK